MSILIKIGDNVSVLDEDIKGKVLSVSLNTVLILDQNGFERTYSSNELVKYDKALDEDRSPIKKHHIKKTSNSVNKHSSSKLNIVDLHHTNSGLTSHNILEGQLRKFKLHLNRAIKNRVAIITFIPGIGAGILRNKIESILKKHQIEYCDAPFHKFGHGAIEVHLKGITKMI